MVDWAAVERATLVLDVVSGVGFALLGAWVLTLRPRGALTSILAAFCIGKGMLVAVSNLAWEIEAIAAPWSMVTLGASVVACAALVALATRFPRPIGAAGRRRALLGPAVVLAAFAAGFVLSPPGRGFALVDNASWALVYATTCALLVLLAWRFGEAADASERRGVALVSAALALEMLLRAGGFVVKVAVGDVAWTDHEPIPFLVASVLVLAAWLRNTSRGPPDARRTARDVALFFAALLPAGALFAAATDPFLAFNLGIMGGARLAGVLLLAYAILRLQLLGLDVRVRWGLSKSTVAAAFIAVFFVASEVAQRLFEESSGPWVGVVAAGMLVFAIAPLQRAAERLAERAVPVSAATVEGPPERPEDTRAAAAYRAAVRAALRDGGITRREELHLMDVAEHVGLTPRQAAALRHEVEDESRPGGA